MSNIDKLLVLQEHDVQIRAIQRQLRDIPARQDEEKRRLAEHQAALEAARTKLKEAQSQIKQLELEIESRRERIARLRTQQLEIKTNREFKAMESEIAGVAAGISEVEDRELVAMEEVESVRREVTEREGALREEEAAVALDVKTLNERATELTAQLKVQEAARREAAVGVDAEWLQFYERVATRRETALARIEAGVCGGCHMRLPPSAGHNVRKADTMVTCDFCGRMLY